ncbi:hypothetical protein Y032_0008g307 [Ancylostoma ceylanicum]|uniref:Uncharacterized protein n=1 Tax=Ancylostoma ceylanicum TaxID=53326 RepID=A0A016VLA6_9BILA|nr:hypothetical protein Y032_0008g307 [Ancylostoma ceylanicum]
MLLCIVCFARDDSSVFVHSVFLSVPFSISLHFPALFISAAFPQLSSSVEQTMICLVIFYMRCVKNEFLFLHFTEWFNYKRLCPYDHCPSFSFTGYKRRQNQQAVLFAKLINEDQIFELFVPQHLGLVCFRVKNSTNEENEALCTAINEDRRIHLVPSKVHGTFFLRLSICSQLTTDDDVRFAYAACKEVLTHLKTSS